MTIFFSAENKGFYDDEIKSTYCDVGAWPDDAVEISNDVYNKMMNGQGDGKIIEPDENGYPVLKDASPPTHNDFVEQADEKKSQLMLEASEQIGTLQDAVDLDMATDAEKLQLTAWKRYRVLLNRVDTSTAPDIDWPEKPE
ncbi:tail fiber assembly protein [Enterobacteriaceae bacterium LUAb1]